MAEVPITPRIRCDNCGLVTDKEPQLSDRKQFGKPRRWGSLVIESGRGQQGYPSEALRFIDLCPSCATIAHDAAADALKSRQGEA